MRSLLAKVLPLFISCFGIFYVRLLYILLCIVDINQVALLCLMSLSELILLTSILRVIWVTVLLLIIIVIVMVIVMMVGSLHPGASVCTAAGWPRYARLKANALGPRRSQKSYRDVRWSCKIYSGQTVLRTVRGSNVQTARRSKNV